MKSEELKEKIINTINVVSYEDLLLIEYALDDLERLERRLKPWELGGKDV